MASSAVTRLSLARVREVCYAALKANGLNEASAQAVTQVVVAAERDGCHSHGLFRVPGYCEALRDGTVDGSVAPVVTDKAPGVVSVDAAGGYAPAAFDAGKAMLAAKARENGVAVMSIRNSVHFAALWYETEHLAEHERLVAMAFVNANSYVAHYGGKRKTYGTNPMSFAFPRAAGRPPVCFDQAASTMARGEIMIYEREGKQLPPGVAVDADGNPTTDPTAALAGAQLTYGGPKGTSIALMVELLAAGLTGSPFSFEAAASHPPGYQGPTKHGELIVAIDPARFAGADEDGAAAGASAAEDARGDAIAARCEAMFGFVLSEPEPAKVRLPGDRRHAMRLKTPTDGIEIPQALYDEICALASKVQEGTDGGSGERGEKA